MYLPLYYNGRLADELGSASPVKTCSSQVVFKCSRKENAGRKRTCPLCTSLKQVIIYIYNTSGHMFTIAKYMYESEIYILKCIQGLSVVTHTCNTSVCETRVKGVSKVEASLSYAIRSHLTQEKGKQANKQNL